ncbi:hypothetical protein [Streptomyces capitiformicae]|uniref:Uncharacterized protein n=1 Tax=Streptomyces capitiformicae TaxID=2014920 RepID=A0A919L7J8_9ACTN|nr:hypothetical protein [Streptomyces capitiformicae]GHH87820.1 hypothetical protein GCM10017771_30500 [Streptomyces capitiformicae]
MAIYRCKEPFRTTVNGAKRVVPAGELIEDSDPVFKGREHLFQKVDDYVARHSPTVERATAEPGEKRGLGRPRTTKAAAAKTAAPKPNDDKSGPKAAPAKGSDGGTS